MVRGYRTTQTARHVVLRVPQLGGALYDYGMGKRTNYWKMAYGRAWRETWARGPWSSPLRVLLAIAAALASTAAGWATSHELPVAALSGLAAIGVLSIIAVPVRAHFLLPPVIHGEDADKVELLDRSVKAWAEGRPDTPFVQAVSYRLHGVWTGEIDWRAPETMDGISQFLEDIRQLAHLGDVRVWGRSKRGGVLSVLKRQDWANYGIDLISLTRLDRDGTCTGDTGLGHIERYLDLHVSRAEIEREFRRT